ncbi:copper resistance membrane spanning protein PcoS [Klebsiella quasipneumoniae]|uniref:copper resistance membrane spanning protein PcoS n=1 Tax=Klebsiella quasipneumoniae TaxID=1463165 RepID=UPI00256C47F1|nr:copper resistance membrane spanning protein PcoS [Klebsiella quasipneumoniae]MDL4071245.1 copper resistance membrane spanning protein PcoS [Klebsiella quasipneumoniae]
MRFKISLTTRLSLIFSAVMLTVWWLSSFILISTLNGYFDNQDRDFLTGKLQLTEEFLKTETFRNKTDIKSLSEKINDAMVGHNGLFISIKNMENEKIVELYAKNSVVPAVLLNKSGDILDYMIQTEENNTVYRSISRRVAVTPEQGKSKHVIITVATDTGYHTLFMDKLSTWLFWFNIGLVFISVFLGWLTTRIGLKPLREMTSLASSMTVHSLDQRLNPDLAPPEISETMQEFNNMFDRLEGAFRKLSDFSSDIAHELRTPVSNLMMQTQFALAKERDVSHYREILFANLEELKRLSRMTSDMLFLARSEHGLLRLDKHDVDLAAELNELRELFEPLADETGKTITVEGEGVVAGDSDMLRRAFSNLLSNAIKYSPYNTCTAIHLERDSDCVNVMITNTMSGQVPANLERLFDRFYRADSSRFYNTEGAGLGLSITRSIIHAHGGELSAEQQGREIVFSVRLLMD